MATASISGLASGLDSATIISQLMQLEAAPQTKLKSRLTTEQSTLKTLQDLNTRVASLQTQAAGLADAAKWSTAKASSSSSAVTVTATGTVAPASLSVTVDQVAIAHRLTFAGTAAGDAEVVTGGTTVDLTIDGTTTTLETGDGTLDGLVNALNASGTGVNATKIKLDSGEYRLIVTSASTGAAGAFTLTGSDGSDLLGGASVRAGQDARITIGSDTIHSATNTFAGIADGIDLTVSAAAVGSTVDITVERDSSTIAGKMTSLVDAINSTLSQIDSLTAYNASTKTAGPLAGDTSIRSLRDTLLSTVYPSDGTSMAGVGLQTDRNGKLVFDADAFAAAYAADPAGTAAKFTSGDVAGFAARVSAVATTASDKYDGTITSSINGRTSTISRLQGDIEAWDRRLDLRRTTLERQFTALETALSQMNSQSNWLASQISSLTANSNNG